MDVLAVVIINCSVQELRRRDPFTTAAEFSKYEATITFHCLDTGESLQVHCNPPDCRGWRHFENEWQRKHGAISY